jgi:glycosyltransferase involved in cell wall biosynthesis
VSRLQISASHRVFEDFRAVIVHSEFSKRRLLEKRWVSADRIHVIPHGPLQYYNSEEACIRKTPAEEQTLLFFGRIERYKGLDVLIRAFAQLPGERITNTRLVIAGTAGFDLAPLRNLSKRLRVEERISWDVRFIPEEEIPALFRAASVVVLPYLDIDQSGVLMTALAFDKAIVASRVGGIAETIQDGVHGLLTEPGSVESLAKALESLLTNVELRRSMENSVRQLRTRELSWESVAQKTLAVYSQICR